MIAVVCLVMLVYGSLGVVDANIFGILLSVCATLNMLLILYIFYYPDKHASTPQVLVIASCCIMIVIPTVIGILYKEAILLSPLFVSVWLPYAAGFTEPPHSLLLDTICVITFIVASCSIMTIKHPHSLDLAIDIASTVMIVLIFVIVRIGENIHQSAHDDLVAMWLRNILSGVFLRGDGVERLAQLGESISHAIELRMLKNAIREVLDGVGTKEPFHPQPSTIAPVTAITPNPLLTHESSIMTSSLSSCHFVKPPPQPESVPHDAPPPTVIAIHSVDSQEAQDESNLPSPAHTPSMRNRSFSVSQRLVAIMCVGVENADPERCLLCLDELHKQCEYPRTKQHALVLPSCDGSLLVVWGHVPGDDPLTQAIVFSQQLMKASSIAAFAVNVGIGIAIGRVNCAAFACKGHRSYRILGTVQPRAVALMNHALRLRSGAVCLLEDAAAAKCMAGQAVVRVVGNVAIPSEGCEIAATQLLEYVPSQENATGNEWQQQFEFWQAAAAPFELSDFESALDTLRRGDRTLMRGYAARHPRDQVASHLAGSEQVIEIDSALQQDQD